MIGIPGPRELETAFIPNVLMTGTAGMILSMPLRPKIRLVGISGRTYG
jgi:hypothetical protein